MTPNRTRTGLFETPKGQSKPETGFGGKPAPPELPKTRISPAASKFRRLVKTTTTAKSEPGSLPPLQTGRNSVDQSPGSVASGDRSPLSTASLDKSPRSVDSKMPQYSSRINSSSLDRQARAAPKKSELQAELEAAKEELKAANEQLVYLDREKFQALEELQEARRQADEASEQLAVVIAAKEEAEEKIEIEKFRIVEIEQAGIEAAQQREEFWQKEVENIRNQHALDVSALLATTHELERLKHELAMTTEAKNAATAHADDALKIAEIHAEKVGILSSEVNRLKALLESKLENAAKETAEHARRLEVEIDSLRDELRRTREAEKKLGEMEILVKDLKGEIAEAKRAKSDADSLVVMWKKKAELLEIKLDEAVKSEELAEQSLASAIQQLEDRDAAVKEAESEILCLRNKVNSLELEIVRYEGNLDQSNSQLKEAKGELSDLEKTIHLLKSKIEITEEEKNKVLDHKDEIASRIPTLQEENDKLSQELEIIRDEVETRKKAMEGLASALEEATVEAKESQEQLQAKQAEATDALGQLDELKKALKSTEERYDSLLSNAWSEVAMLKNMVEESGIESNGIVSAREIKEEDYMLSIKKSEEEITEIKKEMDKLASRLEGSEKEAAAAKEEGVELRTRLEQARLEAKSAKEAAEVVIEESLQLKERLLDKENALQSIVQENNELRIREEDANQKIAELSTMIEEAILRKEKQDNALSNKEEDHDVEPKVTESAMETEVTEDAYKPEFNDESSAEPHHVKEHSVQEAIRVDSLKESNDVLDDKFEEASNHVNKASSPERDTEPVHLDLRQHLKSELESLDPKVEEMSPSREPPEKKKKKFLSKLFKTKSHLK